MPVKSIDNDPGSGVAAIPPIGPPTVPLKVPESAFPDQLTVPSGLVESTTNVPQVKGTLLKLARSIVKGEMSNVTLEELKDPTLHPNEARRPDTDAPVTPDIPEIVMLSDMVFPLKSTIEPGCSVMP